MNKNYIPPQAILVALSLVLIIFSVFYLYWPSIPGPFMFDDWPNLGVMNRHTYLDEFQRLLIFITNQGTSFTGRPLSLLSFYLNDISWPSNPEGFRFTNISIHSLNSVLVWWLTFRLIGLYNPVISENKKIIITSFVALVWALHPIHVNATAFIIQRMTLLSGTFILAGMICYTYGREILHNDNIRKGIILLSASIIIFMPLAFLSKQNGVLLLLYIGVTEFTLFNNLKNRVLIKRWASLFILVPVITILIVLTIKSNEKVFQWYDALPYTPYERLLTQTRILFDYLSTIILPQARTSTLFHDGYIISRSLMSPITTVSSVIGIVVLLFFAIIKRHHWTLFSFAVGWYLAGHVIESTIIGLELYYEHRNYIPAYGILFGSIMIIYKLLSKRTIAISLLGISYLTLLGFVTYINTNTWNQRPILVANWYDENPRSLRAAVLAAGTMNDIGNYEKARSIVAQAINYWPNMADPYLLMLLLECLNNKTNNETVANVISSIPVNYDHSNSLLDIIEKLKEPINNNQCPALNTQDLERIVLHLIKNPNLNRPNKSNKWATLSYNINYWMAIAVSEKGNLNDAMHYSEQALAAKTNPSLYHLQALWLENAGLYKESRLHLQQALVESRKISLFDYVNPYLEDILSYSEYLNSQSNENKKSN